MTATKAKAPVLGTTEAFWNEPTHTNEGLKMNSTTTRQAIAIPDLAIVDGQITTTSTQVADHFDKRHDTVLRAIRNLECSDDYRRRNFAETFIEVAGPNGATRKTPCFRMTRDGFVFLAMGFTGKEAAHWKEAYIDAFNKMEIELLNKSARQAVQLSTVKDAVSRLAQQVESQPAELFMPLVNAVLCKQGFTFLLPEAQQKEIMSRLDQMRSSLNPMSDKALEVLGVIRALRGLHPRIGVHEPAYRQVVQRFEPGFF